MANALFDTSSFDTSSPLSSAYPVAREGDGHDSEPGVRRAAERSQQLLTITAAIAEAVDTERVIEAVVDRVAAALGASSGALWCISGDGSRLNLLRSFGLHEELARVCAEPPLDQSPPLPAVDAARLEAPVWITSQQDFSRTYPHFADLRAPGQRWSCACLPLMFQGQVRGVLAFCFPGERPFEPAERDFLMLVARYAAQALERLRLLEAERALRAANERARVRVEVLYELAAGVIRAGTVNEVFERALDGIERALGTSRCSILAFDADDVMRFKAWRGLSEEYRRAVEGHSPWRRDEQNPVPIVVADALSDPSLSAYAPLFRREKIGALGFIPLVSEGQLIGKFMVYYPEPRELSAAELDMASAIANHVAAVMGRFAALGELERTVRFNELFTGMLGHDLRNPLGAIMTAAQMAAQRSAATPFEKPLARIMKSSERMVAMIDQLLDFTRVRVGAGITIHPRPADLEKLLRQAVDELRDSYPSWRFDVRASAGDASGEWDGDRILQVFSNLVGNAVQHGAAEHGIDVHIEASDPAQVSVRIHNMGAISSERLPHLFEPMSGGERHGSNARGLGLGLYISQQLVQAHGGSIEVESSALAGTTFTVRLPRLARG